MLPVLLAFFAAGSQAATTAPADQLSIDEVIGLVNQHCGTCHPPPPPTVMPKKNWPFAVQVMADLTNERMGKKVISAEVVRNITAYYYGSAPESLPVLPYYENTGHTLTFSPAILSNKSTIPLVINISSVELKGIASPQFLVCDGGRNEVSLLTKTGETWQETVLAEVQVPSHTEVVDYDGDGDDDIIVAALGHFPPSERLAGKVLMLRQSPTGAFDREVILEDVGRISDTRPADLDNDGDLDLAVSVFGGGNVGEVAWLENTGKGAHTKHTLLRLSGALNVSPVDLNADGRIDLVSLISQEHEVVIALINQGRGQFEQVLLGGAPHPMFGFTGMNLVDLDGDGDTDMLLTNGDALDLQKDPKPYHGVQWLENQGGLKFQYHDIGRFYGAANAVAGDLDADGDLDIVASSWNNDWKDPRRQRMIWFENDGRQNFTGHNILNGPPGIVSLALEDVTGDGRLDIIAAVFHIDLLTDPASQNDRENTANSRQELSEARLLLLVNNGAPNH